MAVYKRNYIVNTWDTFKIHPVKFEKRLPIEGKGRSNSDNEKEKKNN